MQSYIYLNSPLGRLLVAADEEGIIGIWIENQKYYARTLCADAVEQKTPLLDQAASWLEKYFAKEDPGPFPPLHLCGTPFQIKVWKKMAEIPYGKTISYKQLALELDPSRPPAVRAAANAVAHNPLMIVCPCHRIIGSDGSLVGYAGGIERKIRLLCHENPAIESSLVRKPSGRWVLRQDRQKDR